MCLQEENRMKQSIKRSLLTTFLFVVVAAGILKLGGDYPTLASYMNPRLLTSILVVWIVSQGLFSVFTDSYLKKLLPWAAGPVPSGDAICLCGILCGHGRRNGHVCHDGYYGYAQ